jgi:hypothetical protein
VFSQNCVDSEMHAATVDGEPGVVLTSGGRVVRVVALHIESSVRAVDMTDSPDELSRWSVAQVE